MIRKNLKTKKAFTLLEVLIATSVFAIVMVMTTGAISSSSNYQAKIKAMRDVNNSSNKIADSIARDLRSAEGEIKVKANAGASAVTFKNGVALALCDASACTLKDNTAPADNFGNPDANVLIINTKDSSGNAIWKVYTINNNVVYLTSAEPDHYLHFTSYDAASKTYALLLKSTLNSLITNLMSAPGINDDTHALSDSNTTENSVIFSGFTYVDGGTTRAQSYVSFSVTSKTKNYDILASRPSERASTTIRSMVTMRNYAL